MHFTKKTEVIEHLDGKYSVQNAKEHFLVDVHTL